MIVTVSGVVVGIDNQSYTPKGETSEVRRFVVHVQQDPSGQSAPAEVSVSLEHLASLPEVVYGKQTSVVCDAQAYNGERFARLVLRTKGMFAPQAK